MIDPDEYIGGPITVDPNLDLEPLVKAQKLHAKNLASMDRLFVRGVLLYAFYRALCLLLAALITIVIFCLLWWHYAQAAPPPNVNPEFTPFFQSLANPKKDGMHCCGANDCRPVMWRINLDHYEVFPTAASYENLPVELLDHWYIVPADAVLDRTDNPTGSALACLRSMGGTVDIMCFVRETES